MRVLLWLALMIAADGVATAQPGAFGGGTPVPADTAATRAEPFLAVIVADTEVAQFTPLRFVDLLELIEEYGVDVSVAVNDVRVNDSTKCPWVVAFVVDRQSLRRVPDTCIMRIRYQDRVPAIILFEGMFMLRAPTLEELLPYQARGEMELITLQLRHRGRYYYDVPIRVVYAR